MSQRVILWESVMPQHEQDAVKLAKITDKRSKLARRATVAMSLAIAMNSFITSADADYDLPSFPQCHEASSADNGVPEYPFQGTCKKVCTGELASTVVRLSGLRSKTQTVITASAQTPVKSDCSDKCSSESGLALPTQLPNLDVPPDIALPPLPSPSKASNTSLDAPQGSEGKLALEIPTPAQPTLAVPTITPTTAASESANGRAPELVKNGRKMTLSVGQTGSSAETSETQQDSLMDLGDALLSSVVPSPDSTPATNSEDLLDLGEDLINSVAASPEPVIASNEEDPSDGSFHLSDSDQVATVVKETDLDSAVVKPAPKAATMAELVASDQASKTPLIAASPAQEPKRIQQEIPQVRPIQAEPIELAPVQVTQVSEPKLVPATPVAVTTGIPAAVLPSPIQTAAAAAPSRRLRALPISSKTEGVAIQLEAQATQLLRSSQPIAEMSVENPDVCKLIPNGKQSVTCIGLKPGVTRIALISQSQTGQRHLELREVTVGQRTTAEDQHTNVAAEMTKAIDQLYPSASVTVTAKGGKLIVEGIAGSEQDARKILSLIRKASLTPVEDKLETL